MGDVTIVINGGLSNIVMPHNTFKLDMSQSYIGSPKNKLTNPKL